MKFVLRLTVMPDNCPTSPTGYPSDCEILEGYRTRAREKNSGVASPDRALARARAKDVELLLLDVDGVLTDGTLTYSSNEVESKTFHTQDGFGIRLLQEAGVAVGIITARKSEIVARRAAELKMRYVYQGISNKNEAFKGVLKESGLKPYQIAYMGDDWLDLVLLNQVGLALAPSNAVVEVRESVHFVSGQRGGSGAVRDACNLILESKNLTAQLLQKYLCR